MLTQLKLGEIVVDVALKDIKNVHLSVYPPTGRVHISAPRRMSLDTIRVFAVSKLGWIKQQRKRLQGQERETRREYLDRESHYVWGRRYLLKVVEGMPAGIQLKHSRMVLQVQPGGSHSARQPIVARWYRDQIRAVLPDLMAKWEKTLDVKVQRVFVQRMKTKWGSCNPSKHSIRLNTDLAKKPRECLEYIVVHEMVHLIERHHNDRFRAYMDQSMPHWQRYRDQLNAAPLSHQEWDY